MDQYEIDKLLKQIAELQQELNASKKYGLVWDKESTKEKVVLDCETKIPTLFFDNSKTIKSGNENNILIEGDNFHILTTLNLLSQGDGIADAIYIDPPYNTGEKNFSYNDSFVEKDDSFKHSKWLSFMNSRLKLSVSLLKDTGVIFISIGDNEFGPLKLLCDSIFGERNFLGDIVWQSNTQPVNAGRAKFSLQKTCDHTYAYAKKKSELPDFLLGSIKKEQKYPYHDEKGDFRTEIIEKRDAGRDKRTTMKFPILGIMPREGKRWQIGLETAKLYEQKGLLVVQNGIVKKKIYASEETLSNSYSPFWALLLADEVGTAQTGKAQMIDALGFDPGYETVKSVGLMKSLLSHFSKNSLFLDFFAGSGTTGQAVLELNKEDDGNRRFILCTNNENKICTNITYPRLKTIITGIRQDGSKYSDEIPSNLYYFKTGFIEDLNNSDQAKYNLAEKVDSLLCIAEDIFDEKERNDYSSHFVSSDKKRHLFIYNDYFNKEKFDEFKERVIKANGRKVVYVFSFDNNLDESLFDDKSINVKPIPEKIYEIYKEIALSIKKGE